MKKILLTILTVLCLLLLCACGRNEPEGETTPQGKKVLRVLTDQTSWDQMNALVDTRTKAFKYHAHSDVEVEVEILSREDTEVRELQLQRLRTEILAGQGPDIFLLPTSDTYSIMDLNSYMSFSADSLIRDVQMAMRNNLFLDLSSFYDQDEALGKDALNETVMDAGVLEGERLVLPLAYDMYVYLIDRARLEELNRDEEWLSTVTATQILEEALAEGNQKLAGGAYPMSMRNGGFLSIFPDFVDYSTGNLNITEAELAAFLTQIREAHFLFGSSEYVLSPDLEGYINHPHRNGLSERSSPLYQGTLFEAYQIAKISAFTYTDLVMEPVRASDGSVVAHVTYYGAINRNTAYPELAYEYLREFLTEEYQWEQNRPKEGDASKMPDRYKTKGTVAYGWPVRTKGSALGMNDISVRGNLIYYGEPYSEVSQSDANAIFAMVKSKRLRDEDFPILFEKIDRVRFPVAMEDTWGLAAMMSTAPPEISANILYDEMRYFFAES